MGDGTDIMVIRDRHINIRAFRPVNWVFSLILLLSTNFASAQLSASFDIKNHEGCVPLIVEFENTSTGNPDSVIWNFGNGNQSTEKLAVQAAYNTPGEFIVTLTVVKNGVSSSASRKVIAYAHPQADFTADIISGCIPLEVAFRSTSVPAQNPIKEWTWDFGDGRGSSAEHPRQTYLAENGYNVTLVVTDDKGCKGLVRKDTFIYATNKPEIDFTYSDTITCKLPLNVRFTGNVQSRYPVTYHWDFGNGQTGTQINGNASYALEKVFPVTFSVENKYGCKEQITRRVNIVDESLIPQILLNSNSGCAPFTLEYKAATNMPVRTHFWNFGANGNSTDSTGKIVFSNPGTYNITLLVTDGAGCSGLATQQIVVHERPKATFTQDKTEACLPPLMVNFASTTPGVVSHYWSFGSGIGAAVEANPVRTFNNNGAYTIRYIATNAFGCKDTITKAAAVLVSEPTVVIEVGNALGCVPLTSSLGILKTGPGTISSVEWTFSDGQKYTGLTPAPRDYPVQGSYLETAVVSFSDNCPTKTVYGTVLAGEKPSFSGKVTPLQVCVKSPGVKGELTSGSSSTEYTWYFGDGGQVDGAKVSYEYSDPGKFDVSLVGMNNGCSDSIYIQTIEVLPPAALFSVANRCNGTHLTFRNNSVGHSASVWNFGDGTILSDNHTTVSHIFPDTGKYAVKLTVTNPATGCTDSIVEEIEIKRFVGSIQLQPLVGCPPFEAVLRDTSPEYRTLRWDFGDQVINSRTVRKTFSDPGVYDVKIYATRVEGCQDTFNFPGLIKVVDVQADFDFSPIGGCAPIDVHFQDLSRSDHSNIAAWKWDFAGKGNADVQNPDFIFLQNDSMNVTLIATDNIGCKDTISKKVPVIIPVADFSTEYQSVCTNVNFAFNNLSSGVGLNYQWNFGDGVLSDEQHPVKVYNKEGKYDIQLIITDANNCKDTVTKTSYVSVENFTYDFDGYPRFKTCPELLTGFTVSPSTLTYKQAFWDFGNGNQSLDTSRFPVNIYTESGKFDVSLILEDYRGCRDTIVKKDFIEVKGPRGTLEFAPKSGCIPLEVVFEASFVDTKVNFWDFGDGIGVFDKDLKTSMIHRYEESGIIKPSLVLDDGLGCVVHIEADSIIVSGVKVKIEADQQGICTGGEVLFTDHSKDYEYASILSRKWDFGNGNQSGDISSLQRYTADSISTFWASLTIETSLGCVDKDSVPIKVFVYPGISAGEDKVICKGDEVKLSASGAAYYDWSPKRTMADPASATPTVKPLTDTWYSVIGYDTIACVSSDSVLVRVVENFEVAAGPDSTICLGNGLELYAQVSNIHSGKFEYTWMPDLYLTIKDDGTVWAQPEEDIAYSVNIRNGSCKEVTYPIFIGVAVPPGVTAAFDETIVKGQSARIVAESDQRVTYQWSPPDNISCLNCPNPEVRPEVSTVYKVVGTNEYGCQGIDSVQIEVLDLCSGRHLAVPNTFTPNGDGLHDIFRVPSSDFIFLKWMRIYNRFGEKIFETIDNEKGWDGNFNNEPVNAGVYVYYIETECVDGQKSMIKGNVTLLR